MNVITRVTHGVPHVPSAVERMAAWFERSAGLRASASLGDDYALETAPNVIPLHPLNRLGKIEAIVLAVRLHCRRRRYDAWIERNATITGVMRLRNGASMATAIGSALVRADFAAKHGRDPEAA